MSVQRLFTLVGKAPPNERARHFVGMPPEITGAESEQTRLSRALVLIIEEQADGFFLYRYTTGAAFAGDTWHLTLDEAKEQAVFEYGDALGGWNSVPESSEDAVKYALHEAGIE